MNDCVNVKPVIVSAFPDAHQVWLDIGCQHFAIGEYLETKDEAEWLANQLRTALTAFILQLRPPAHKFWGAGEVDCPADIKSANGELHTLRCKVCGKDNNKQPCMPLRAAPDELAQAMLNDDIVRLPAQTTEQPAPFDALATMDELIDYNATSIKRLHIKLKKADGAGCAQTYSRIERVIDWKKHKLEKQHAVRKAIGQLIYDKVFAETLAELLQDRLDSFRSRGIFNFTGTFDEDAARAPGVIKTEPFALPSAIFVHERQVNLYVALEHATANYYTNYMQDEATEEDDPKLLVCSEEQHKAAKRVKDALKAMGHKV